MEINLILTANQWQLASQLERTKPYGGVLIIKNIPERTYLAVTPLQWQVLGRFSSPHLVPQVLESIIEDRACPALSEFYELILKAVQARILVTPGQTVAAIPALNWRFTLDPVRLRIPLWILFAAGFGFTAGLQPELPSTLAAWSCSFLSLVVACLLGFTLSASLLRGGGGEVYLRRGWLICNEDARMLRPAAHRTVTLAPLAVLAAGTGILTWSRPEWSLLPLVGLLFLARPLGGGRCNRMIRARAGRRLSDADHSFLFPPNRSTRMRLKLVRTGLFNAVTWLEIGYAVLWTLVVGYFVGVLTEVPSWTLAFWETQGPRLAWAIMGPLVLLAILYAGSEFYLFLRARARARRETMRQWWRRWFGRKPESVPENERLSAVRRSALLRTLPPPVQFATAKALTLHRAGPWRLLQDFEAPAPKVWLILSGQVGIYRKLPSGRRVRVQVLAEDNLVGLHAAADPVLPQFQYRTLTPVVLLQLDWAQAAELILARIPAATLANYIQKLPFLARISLCQNWHLLAVQRFAEMARITNYHPDEAILQEGCMTEDFFVMFEGGARVMRKGRLRGLVGSGDFFGEIGLLQNSAAMARVVANPGARGLCIRRREFLRFVAHNYTVALRLERVSSQRLGHPIFPMPPGNFQMI